MTRANSFPSLALACLAFASVYYPFSTQVCYCSVLAHRSDLSDLSSRTTPPCPRWFCARRQHLLRFVCGAHIRSSLVQLILERGQRLAGLG